ncbi:MAG: thiol reductant ABC exporter subunit CydD, partial [Eggerthellaceae bacterium]|nr:thiol reductant ABC exporter subunit CydD [Eggerthellaceae bacterium]
MFDKAVFQLPGIRGMLLVTCALTLVRALFVVGQAVGLANVIVNVWNGQLLAAQVMWLILFLICFVGRQAVLTVQSSLLDRYAHDRADELRDEMLRLVFASGPALVQQMGSASVTSTVIQGVEDARTYIALIIPKMAAVVVVPFVLLCVMFPLDWVSGLIALICFPFIILYMVMIGHTAKDDAAKRHGEFQQMANHFIDAVGGMDTLRAFGRSRAYGDTVYRASERFRQLTMKTLRIATLSSAVLDVFATLALAGVAVMLGFRLVDGSVAFFPALTVL